MASLCSGKEFFSPISAQEDVEEASGKRGEIRKGHLDLSPVWWVADRGISGQWETVLDRSQSQVLW